MSQSYKSYSSWSTSVRCFHWINVLTVIALILIGLIMLNKKSLGISGLEAKIGLKELHVIIGYIFATNLLIRLFFAFFGPVSARFSAFIPGKGFMQNLQDYRSSLKAGKPQQFIGHNPLGKLAVSALFSLLIIMTISGLIRAGTDIYFPPFGSVIRSYIAQDGVAPEMIKPYQKEGTDAQKIAMLKAFKSPIGSLHLYSAYLLMLLIIIHIAAVIRAEVKENEPLVSSMISGKKLMSNEPPDK